MSGFESIKIYSPSFIKEKFSSADTSAEITVQENISLSLISYSGADINKITVKAPGGGTLFEKSGISSSCGYIQTPRINATGATIRVENAAAVSFKELKLLDTLASLGDSAANFTRADYSKQGHFYLNDGSLLAWKEYRKAAGRLGVSNCAFRLKEKILNAFDKYNFLTFHLNPGLDADSFYDFALTKAPSERFDVKTGLFELEFDLTQR